MSNNYNNRTPRRRSNEQSIQTNAAAREREDRLRRRAIEREVQMLLDADPNWGMTPRKIVAACYEPGVHTAPVVVFA